MRVSPHTVVYKGNVQPVFAGPLDQYTALVTWKTAWHLRKESDPMQRQFTIELRVDYDDVGKNEAMRIAIKQAAQHVYAMANMLKDGQKPQIAAFSDDWYSGREEIEVIPDTIQSGLDAIAVDGDDAANEGPSSELLAAFK